MCGVRVCLFVDRGRIWLLNVFLLLMREVRSLYPCADAWLKYNSVSFIYEARIIRLLNGTFHSALELCDFSLTELR